MNQGFITKPKTYIKQTLTLLSLILFWNCDICSDLSAATNFGDDCSDDETTLVVAAENNIDYFETPDDIFSEPYAHKIILIIGELHSQSHELYNQVIQLYRSRQTTDNVEAIESHKRVNELLMETEQSIKAVQQEMYFLTRTEREIIRFGTKYAANTGAATTNVATDIAIIGFVAGAVDSVNVDSSGRNAGIVDIVVGGQSFQGIIPLSTIGNIQLTSVIDQANTITLNVTADGLDTTDAIQRELNKLFQLDLGCPISLRSTSTDLARNFTIFKACTNTAPGIYGVSYGYNSIAGTVTYKISNGPQVWEKTYSAFLSSDSDLGKNARTVLFDNGFTIETARENDERYPTIGIELVNVQA